MRIIQTKPNLKRSNNRIIKGEYKSSIHIDLRYTVSHHHFCLYQKDNHSSQVKLSQTIKGLRCLVPKLTGTNAYWFEFSQGILTVIQAIV